MGLHVPVNTGGVNIYMNYFRIGRKFRYKACYSVVKSGSYCNQCISICYCHVRIPCTVHTKHSERKRVIFRKRTQAEKGCCYRSIYFFGKFYKFLCTARADNTASCIYYRFFTIGNNFRCCIDIIHACFK